MRVKRPCHLWSRSRGAKQEEFRHVPVKRYREFVPDRGGVPDVLRYPEIPAELDGAVYLALNVVEPGKAPGRPGAFSFQAWFSAGRVSGVDESLAVGEDERHLHIDPVSGDLAVLDNDLLVLDPGAFDVLQGFRGARDALFDGILKTLLGR